METTAISVTSLPPKPAAKTQPPIGGPASGEFTKVLQAQPDQAENPGGKNSDGQDGERRSAEGQETAVLLLSMLPALLPEGRILSGENGLEAASSPLQYFGNNEPAQGSNATLKAGAQGKATALTRQEGPNGDISPLLEEPFPLGPLPEEISLKDVSTLGALSPAKGTADSFAGEKTRIPGADLQFWQNPEGGEGFWKELTNSTKTDPANFTWAFSGKENDPLLSDLKKSESSASGNAKAADFFGDFSPPIERSAAFRPTGEIRLESNPGFAPSLKAEIHEQISQKMIWSLARNEETFRLTLDPPHLGSIYMEIQRDKEQVKATLWAENPNTKQILESNQISIQKIVETEGFSLEAFNVFVEQDLSAFQENREKMLKNPEPATSNPPAENKSEPGGGLLTPGLFVQRSSGGGRSIDLII